MPDRAGETVPVRRFDARPARHTVTSTLAFGIGAGLFAAVLVLGGRAWDSPNFTGAFGYADDGVGEVNNLTALHVIDVLLGPLGFVLTMAGACMSVGAVLANRRGVTGSWLFTMFVVLAIVAVAAFVLGALIFGY